MLTPTINYDWVEKVKANMFTLKNEIININLFGGSELLFTDY